MPEAAQERVDKTALLRGILNAYPQTSILREYLQNSDDARASSQTFILDQRLHPSHSLVDSILEDRQGPALVAINNATMKSADWDAIRTIHSSIKLTDGSATGKNGLGFRASYHLTENPHIFSGPKLLILDPHHKFTENPGGVSIDVLRERDQYNDQFSPFASVTKKSIAPYNGTMFRLPLRTSKQAKISKIKNSATTVHDILSLLSAFCKNDLEEVVLFLRYIRTIEVKNIEANGTVVIMGRVSVVREEKCCRIDLSINGGPVSRRVWGIHHLQAQDDEAAHILSKQLRYGIGDQLRVEKLSSAVSLAFPTTGSKVSGKLFTLLPLPIMTHFPIHINADFALTPDRQNLKNIMEGGDLQSRDSFLVEWNKIIFDTYAPRAWAQLLEDVTRDAETSQMGLSYALWPPESKDSGSYWSKIATRTIQEVLEKNLPVFPTAVSVEDNVFDFMSLNDRLVILSSPTPPVDLELLAELGIKAVKPPQHIFKILKKLQDSFSFSIVSPEALYECLQDLFSGEQTLKSTRDLRPLVDYMASLKSSRRTISFISHVPWFTLEDGSPVSLGSPKKCYIVPSSEDESSLFGPYCHSMLSWDCMSDDLRAEVLLPSHHHDLNVSPLKPSHLVPILKDKFGRYGTGKPAKADDHTWLVDFWSWISDWSCCDEFLELEKSFSDLYILPLAKRRLQAFKYRAVDFNVGLDSHSAVVDAWAKLGVYPIDEGLANVSKHLKTVISVPGSPTYVPQLICNCHSDQQSKLSRDDLYALQKSLGAGLSAKKKLALSKKERDRLLEMKVFLVNSGGGGSWCLDSIDDNEIISTRVSDSFPLPSLDGCIFVDIRDSNTAKLVSLLDHTNDMSIKEDRLLKLAFEHWDQQNEDCKTRIVDWAFNNANKSILKILRTLDDLPFVTVKGSDDRVSPDEELISPKSPLAGLYQGEGGKILSGDFAGDFLPVMRQLGFVHESLDEYVIAERLEYLSSAEKDPRRTEKAKLFIECCNTSWRPEYSTLISNETRKKPWMPLKGGSFGSPNDCRDTVSRGTYDEHPFLYDLALKELSNDVQITSSHFRAALGWSESVDLPTLMQQFHATVRLSPQNRTRHERLTVLLECLGLLFEEKQLHQPFLDEFFENFGDKAWVPVSKTSTPIKPKYAFLSDDVDLKPPFHRIIEFEHIGFLQAVGCASRPRYRVLCEELSSLDFSTQKEIQAGIMILQELAEYHMNDDTFEPKEINVPTDDGECARLNEVFYRDTNFTTLLKHAPNALTAVHKSISRKLAEDLGIPFLTSLVVDEDGTGSWSDESDDDEPQMSEDLITRNQGFLREYDASYALNEFIANADDAGAESFSISLDTPTKKGNRVLSPAFEELGNSHVLILANDAELTSSDVLGLMKVGTGGKEDRSATHGRHGLGALSFYYYTDVVTIISGDTVLFLDPSGEYLPRKRHHKRRTALQQTLSHVLTLFPDQLKPYDKRYGFSTKNPHYDGTLFILPLCSKIAPVACSHLEVHDLLKGMYLELAESAFFFTKLKQINAFERKPAQHEIWSFSATRSPVKSFKQGPYHQERKTVTISSKMGTGKKISKSAKEWLVTTLRSVKIPTCHDKTAAALKLDRSQMEVELAVPLDKEKNEHSFLFSTLRLPKATSMPFHMNARFFLSSNRQTIVLDPSGSDRQRDPKTAYNLWILEELIPDLYLSTYDYLFNLEEIEDSEDAYFSNRSWWLVDADDDISKIVRHAFYQKLRHSKYLIFRDVASRSLSFQQSVLSSKEPKIITKILTLIEARGFIVNDWAHDLAELVAVTTVNSQFVKSSLIKVKIELIEELYDSGKLKSGDFPSILEYVRDEPDLAGMSCLLLSTNSVIKIPSSTHHPVYYTAITSLPEMFPCSQFLSHHYQKGLAERLIEDPNINVRHLDTEHFLALIQLQLSDLDVGEARDDWLKTFWELYPTLSDSGLLSLAILEDSNMDVIPSALAYLSINACTASKVVYHSNNRKKPRWFLDVLRKLKVDYIDLIENPIIDKHLHDRFPNQLLNLLLCLTSDSDDEGINAWGKLTSDEAKKTSSWIQRLLTNLKAEDLNPGDLSLLLKLPIWETQRDGMTVRLAPCDLRILPTADINLSTIKPYQRRGVAVASWSPELKKVVCVLKIEEQMLDPRGVLEVVKLPPSVDVGNRKQFSPLKNFLISMLDFSVVQIEGIGLKLPDTSGVLRNIEHLFDRTVPLFEATLGSTERRPFVHSDFEHLLPKLRRLGMQNDITISTFKTCASAISEAALQAEDLRDDELEGVFHMARVAFTSYQDRLPNLVMANRGIWEEIDEYAFMQPAEVVREGIPGNLDVYFERESRSILSPPSELVLRDYHPIVWTQRRPFFIEPTSQNLLRLNRTLGVPTAPEVVAHLRILSTRVAVEHSGNRTVLSDLKATYRWLDDNAEESRAHLIQHLNIKLFLNVNDPEKDSWTDRWMSAKELIPGLHYDHGTLRSIKAFMKHYDKLLECAGCKPFEIDLKSLNDPGSDVETRHTASRKISNEMRLSEEYTDVVLVPTPSPDRVLPCIIEDENSSTEGPLDEDDRLFFESMDKLADAPLHAHRAFLASMFPYIRNAGQGWKKSGEIPFFGSAFGAKALLDFAYTGDFQPPTMPSESAHRGCTRLMYELLALLTIADEWELPDFKNLLEKKFIYEYRIIERLSDKRQTMFNEAKTYGADKMIEVITAFKVLSDKNSKTKA